MLKVMQSPIGKLYLQIEDGELTTILFEEPQGLLSRNDDSRNEKVFEKTLKQLNEYFCGERISFDLPLHAHGTAFQKGVWAQLPHIAYGQTISYQELAERIENPKACRAVGQANRRNPLPIVVPCHRVIGKDKTLKGYAGSLTSIKEFLLQLEMEFTEQSLNR